MNEIGGYIEFEHYDRPMLHEAAIKLNCGRNALAYLIETKGIKTISMPLFMCDSCEVVFKKYKVLVHYYSIGLDFKPNEIKLEKDEWLYIVNYYGQLTNDYFVYLKERYKNLIVDNCQAYFQLPVSGIDTLYSCRKYFGVSDGAILYTDKKLERELSIDESHNRMTFLLGRFERSASEFYAGYVDNNRIFNNEPIKTMSRLTKNFLSGIDYDKVRQIRYTNFSYLHSELKAINKLQLSCPNGAFMYPLYIENGAKIRKKLQEKKIYIPTLWPAVLTRCTVGECQFDMALNILPLPIDQRYSKEHMDYLIEQIKSNLK